MQNDKLIIVQNEPDDDESQITYCTRTKKRSVKMPSSSTADASSQPDSLDHVVSLPCRTNSELKTSATDLFTMFIDHTTDLRDYFQTMRNMVDAKETQLQQEQAQREQEEVENEQLHLERQPGR